MLAHIGSQIPGTSRRREESTRTRSALVVSLVTRQVEGGSVSNENRTSVNSQRSGMAHICSFALDFPGKIIFMRDGEKKSTNPASTLLLFPLLTNHMVSFCCSSKWNKVMVYKIALSLDCSPTKELV